jgi:hypothetical protein
MAKVLVNNHNKNKVKSKIHPCAFDVNQISHWGFSKVIILILVLSVRVNLLIPSTLVDRLPPVPKNQFVQSHYDMSPQKSC